jgi:hypothetical protein
LVQNELKKLKLIVVIVCVVYSRGLDILPAAGSGADFFGLTNPVIQNLIQSCPGSKKCAGYRWVKFEINKEETDENMAVGKTDPTISVHAFYTLLTQAGECSFTRLLHTLNTGW